MSATTTTAIRPQPRSRTRARTVTRRFVRTAWAASALFWGALAVMEGMNHGALAYLFAAVFFIAPDLTFLVAVRDARTARPGQLPPRAVPFYNAAHRALVPVALLVIYTYAPITWAPILAALSGWIAHISMDRAFGYGLRTKEGFQRAH
ncbi:DUF4260 domain-containing protein [Streptomyces sp. A7024]|uniref:DUF4260 domain-containing protein n=1 Tax=Streptomyces coryli TaxID=1128680 RepID=A0A6G4TZP9_9ACTN|nr:DUF4260 family protein [Streptomyces coryli]NGN64990.1 DUF4260 domain-containing protein [Streptomyces coryli]